MEYLMKKVVLRNCKNLHDLQAACHAVDYFRRKWPKRELGMYHGVALEMAKVQFYVYVTKTQIVCFKEPPQ
jgi:hypothetical protein